MRSYFPCCTTIIRLINHSIDPPGYQSIDRSQSINHSINRSKERSLSRSITRSVLIDHSNFRSVNHSNFRSVNHSINQLINQSIIYQSVYRSTERSIAIEQSIYRSIDHAINQLNHIMFYNFFKCRYGCFVRIESLTFFKIWARILRTLRIQHVQLRSYTHTIRIVTDITDRYVRLVRMVRRIRMCQCDCTLTINSGCLHLIAAF